MKTVVLIMAGGRGERFWPLSRIDHPKQFLCLTNDKESMIQKTVNRVLPLVDIKDIYVLTNELYKDKVLEHLPNLPKENIVLEPVAKNTAPAIELGLEKVKEKYDDAAVIVLPSDHLIKDEKAFRNVLSKGVEFASKNMAIITIGITPNEPNTGYGYIKLGNGKDIYKVDSFKEKPSLEVAKSYLKEGGYVWNAGMFIFTIKTMDEAFKKYLPKQYEIISKDTSRFSEVESISIDYGIMEKADNIFSIPGDFGWDDVGSYLALERINPMDKDNNVIQNKDTVTSDTKGTIIKGTDKKLIATLGVSDLVIVETDDVILVADKNKTGDIKKLLEEVKKQNQEKL
jgi:mannose-1-phosphate guanylyltransferase